MTPDLGMSLDAPALVAWRLTAACGLACPHCCASSSPDRADGELSCSEALRLADELVEAKVPKVLLCGGEPMLSPHFLAVARRLGEGGVTLKLETNGQGRVAEALEALKGLPVASVQVSLDGDTQAVFALMRPGASLEAAWAACRAVAASGIALEAAFVPTRLNIHEAGAVADRAAGLGASRFNTGKLMRLGRAARAWASLEPSRGRYAAFLRLLRLKERQYRGRMEVRFKPLSLGRALSAMRRRPPASMLVLPDGKVKAAAALPFVAADLRACGLLEAWRAVKRAWREPAVLSAAERAAADESLLARADDLVLMYQADLARRPAKAAPDAEKVPGCRAVIASRG